MSAFHSNSRCEKLEAPIFCSSFQVCFTAAASICLTVYSLRRLLQSQISLRCRLIFIIQEWHSVFSHPCNWKMVQIHFEWGLLVLASATKNKILYQKIALIQNPDTAAEQNGLFMCMCTCCGSVSWDPHLSLMCVCAMNTHNPLCTALHRPV